MSKIFQLLESLQNSIFVTGNECTYSGRTKTDIFSKFGAEIDDFGNLWIIKKSNNKNAKNILIEAHLDQIGLCVKEITDQGFLAVSPCGGFDVNLIPGTEFTIHSERKYKAIAGSVPPHLLKKDETDKKLSFEDVYLDCGFATKKEAEKHIKIGSPVTFAAPCKILSNNCICSPSLDNKAAVISLLLASEKANCENNLYFLFSVGEESTSRGVKCAEFPVKFDLGIVVDAGFARAKGLDSDQCIFMNKGPSVSIADTLSRKASLWAIQVAQNSKLPIQIIVEPGGTGTSTTALQLRDGGIPSVLISIPLKNMHTQSEIVSECDIHSTVDLLVTLLAQKILPFGEVNQFGSLKL